NLPSMLDIYDQIQRNGFEGDIVILGLSEHLRNLLVCKDAKTVHLLELSDTLNKRYKEQASLCSMSMLLTGLHIANECDVNYPRARNKRLHVEIALCKMVHSNKMIPSSFIQQSNEVVGEEKKTLDLIETQEKEELESEELTNSPTPPQNDAEDSISEKITHDQPTTQSASKPAVFDLKSDANIDPAMPKVSSLSSLKKQILEKEANLKVVNEIKLETVLNIWENYAKRNESPSVRNILRSADVKVDKKKINVKVAKRLHKEIIQQEMDLFQNLRDALEIQNLEINLSIDDSMEIPDNLEKPKKLWTIKEKYETMRDINPLVHELRKRLDLKVDNE
ncbi:MAG: hypothetical protein AAGK97_03805, partial [Bacteroidota bacterium]